MRISQHSFVRFLLSLFLLSVTYLPYANTGGEVHIVYNTASPLLRFGVSKLEHALLEQDIKTICHDISDNKAPDILILREKPEATKFVDKNTVAKLFRNISSEGFRVAKVTIHKRVLTVVSALDEKGAMYGSLDLAEQIRMNGSLASIEEKIQQPNQTFRAIKFNLPWSSYRYGEQMAIHLDVCRDLNFWQDFLDMMAENRFNVLSLWNLHPFTYMIRPKNYPAACPFSDAELGDWQQFWRSLFRMAKNRGIDTYIVNWNIVVSPEFASAYNVKERNDTTQIIRDYTRQCVTQVINEYDELTGLGVTLADWMSNMTPKEREEWIEQTFIAGINAANRPARFIHRSVLAGSAEELRRVIDHAGFPEPVWVEVKFNWSHGHSTPKLAMTHASNRGEIDRKFWDPQPKNFKIVWTVRNEDIFILRWGQPDFIRQHISLNNKDYTAGYFIGSEGYIPAKDFSHRLHPNKTWNYVFEKQWLFYMMWGRLLYDPYTPDAVFEAAFVNRYGMDCGNDMLNVYKAVSKTPLRLASFHAGTWDYTLYSEGFLSPVPSKGLNDSVSAFISINEFINHQILDPSLMTIPDYVKATLEKTPLEENTLTPLRLADDTEKDCRNAIDRLVRLKQMGHRFSGSFQCELLDMETWSYLGLYFADKCRAGVALETFRKTGNADEKEKAVTYLEKCLQHWDKVVEITKSHYLEIPYIGSKQWRWSDTYNDPDTFSWEKFRPQVLLDIRLAKEESAEQ